jgi:pyruvate,water dikinase
VIAGRLSAPPEGHRARQAELEAGAAAATARLVEAARRQSLGWLRARVVRRLVRAGRGLLATREHPKYFLVRILATVREAILDAAESLVAEGTIARVDDIWFVRLGELAGTEPFPDRTTIDRRRADFAEDQRRRPPRLFTSDGEVPEVSHRHPVPSGALAGASASVGIAEGRAKVVRDPRATVLEPGEILVAHATDPGWTPLFLNAAGLVLEVGGLMTHGSVVAREYGIPAVVGVIDATGLIATGDRIRVDGTSGYVERLAEEAAAPLE